MAILDIDYKHIYFKGDFKINGWLCKEITIIEYKSCKYDKIISVSGLFVCIYYMDVGDTCTRVQANGPSL